MGADGDSEWSCIYWVRYVQIFLPEDYVKLILCTVKDMVLTEAFYNSLSCFLEEVTGPQHEALLLEEWSQSDDEEWQDELLTYLTQTQTKHPVIIERMVSTCDEDLMKESSYLNDNPRPKLIDSADSHTELMVPLI